MMFEKKYKDTTFYLLDTDENFYVDDDGIQFLRGRIGYGNSDKPRVEEESLIPFLAVQLI